MKKVKGNKFGNPPATLYPSYVQLVLCCVHLWLLAFTLLVSLRWIDM